MGPLPTTATLPMHAFITVDRNAQKNCTSIEKKMNDLEASLLVSTLSLICLGILVWQCKGRYCQTKEETETAFFGNAHNRMRETLNDAAPQTSDDIPTFLPSTAPSACIFFENAYERPIRLIEENSASELVPTPFALSASNAPSACTGVDEAPERMENNEEGTIP
jgi:hypothetical protein